MKRIFLLSFSLFFVCFSSISYSEEKPLKMTFPEMRAVNMGRLIKLKIGMSEKEVLEVMGTRTFYSRKPKFILTNPYRVESIQKKDGTILRILFYYTDIKNKDGAINNDELTPLLLEKGKLIGWGWTFLKGRI